MSESPKEYPSDLERIRATIGDDLTDKLQMELGGQEVYFADNPTYGSPTVLCVGVDAVRKIARELGRGKCMVALGRFSARERMRADARRLIREGVSAGCIAKETGLHSRTVRRIAAEMKEQRSRAKP